MRRLTQAFLLVLLGAGVYFAMPVAERLLSQPEPAELVETPLAQLEVPGVAADATGNVVLDNCLATLQRHNSVSVDLVQSGTVTGRKVETTGAYLQQGRGEEQKFSLLLQGRVGSSTCRVWQVSDGLDLWTDVAWDGADPKARRTVSWVDLRRVRSRLRANNSSTARRQLPPGQTAVESLGAASWAGLGGMAMLLSEMAENYDFGAPRQMSLRNEPVYALIGHWKPHRRDQLLAPQTKDAPDAEQAEEASPEQPQKLVLPERMPHHVLLAVGARDLFPRLIEYRGAADPLSAAGLEDDARFRQSKRPLLKLDLLKPQFGVLFDKDRFAYQPPDGIDWSDATSQRLALVARRRESAKLANRPQTTSSDPRR